MAPKKKGNKKANDDWEAELGETPDPIVAAAQEGEEKDPAKDEAEDDIGGGGGGLLAALKKNKKNKKAKGKHVEEDFVEGEDPSGTDNINGHAEPDAIVDLANKAGPEEATADDVFAAALAKGKGGKGKKDEQTKEDADEDGEGGGLKSKKEKEKEKKEREKQRKKEQVCLLHGSSSIKAELSHRKLTSSCDGRPRRKRLQRQHPRSKPSRRSQSLKLHQSPYQQQTQAREERRSCLRLWLHFRNNRKLSEDNKKSKRNWMLKRKQGLQKRSDWPLKKKKGKKKHAFVRRKRRKKRKNNSRKKANSSRRHRRKPIEEMNSSDSRCWSLVSR